MATKHPRPDGTPLRDAAGPLSAWLAPALLDWLHAKGCTGLTLLEDEDDGAADTVAWRDAPVAGWRVPLGDGHGSGVLLAFDDGAQLTQAEVADVAALFERLHAFPLVPGASGAVLVDHAEVRRLIHDLRNGLNTLLINASLLSRVAAGQPSLARSAQFLESAGASCADNLNRLSELTSRPQGRGKPADRA
jgi:hypothetical protein